MVELQKLSGHHLNIVTRNTALSISFIFALAGCTVTEQTPPVKPPARVVEDPIARLLDLAQVAFDNKQLTTPRESSAYRFYLDVLGIDPDNEAAHLGISNIIEQYLSWALDHAATGNYKRARQYVGRAQSIDETHPNIPPVLKSIKEREQAVVTKFELDSFDVKARRVSKMMLRHIAKQIKPDVTFVTIQAPDDASGRWLYQELNSRVDFRIQAKFEIGKPRIYLSK